MVPDGLHFVRSDDRARAVRSADIGSPLRAGRLSGHFQLAVFMNKIQEAITTVPVQPPQDDAARWTAQIVGMSWDILDRMERAVAKVRERLLRATAALNEAGVPYAVVGGNAVASWVATVDEGAVRTTRDIDLLVRRSDLDSITATLERAGFVRDELLD